MLSLMHHNGQITDYITGAEWLAAALDKIALAKTPADFWHELSKQTKRELYEKLREHGGLQNKSPQPTKIIDLITYNLHKQSHLQITNIKDNTITGLKSVRYVTSKNNKLQYTTHKPLKFKLTILDDKIIIDAEHLDIVNYNINNNKPPEIKQIHQEHDQLTDTTSQAGITRENNWISQLINKI